MSGERWQDPLEGSEPAEAHAPPESARPVFGEVPGEAPTADLGSPGGLRASDEEPSPQPEEPEQPEEPAEAHVIDPVSLTPAPEPVADEPVFAAPEAVVSNPERDMSAFEPPPEAAPLGGPDVDSVAADGHAPAPPPVPGALAGGQAMWERPEVLLGAAFAGGLLIAVLVRRRRS